MYFWLRWNHIIFNFLEKHKSSRTLQLHLLLPTLGTIIALSFHSMNCLNYMRYNITGIYSQYLFLFTHISNLIGNCSFLQFWASIWDNFCFWKLLYFAWIWRKLLLAKQFRASSYILLSIWKHNFIALSLSLKRSQQKSEVSFIFVILETVCPFPPAIFKYFLFVFDFQQFYYDVFSCGLLFIYFCLGFIVPLESEA